MNTKQGFSRIDTECEEFTQEWWAEELRELACAIAYIVAGILVALAFMVSA